MYEIIDKAVIFLCCISLYFFHVNNQFIIIPVILSIVLSSLFIYFEDSRFRLAGNILFALICIFKPNYIIFLPFLLYDILHTKYQFGLLLAPLLYLYHNAEFTSLTLTFTTLFLGIAYLAKYKTDRLNNLRGEYNELRDSSVKTSFQLEEKNQNILKNQDYEINLATLNERNRIAREIHDNIGHLLSRSLLQLGALLTVTKDEAAKEGLSSLKESLSGGMDQIRSSIHQMYDESIDLYLQMESLVKEFVFCPISYDYDIKNPPPLLLKHSFIAITKEALSNIIRHSNATKVSLALREHPAIYQLVIWDNGSISDRKQKEFAKALEKQEFGNGMGLRNIYDRVKSFGGNINVNMEHGFRIFISIPKKQEDISNQR